MMLQYIWVTINASSGQILFSIIFFLLAVLHLLFVHLFCNTANLSSPSESFSTNCFEINHEQAHNAIYIPLVAVSLINCHTMLCAKYQCLSDISHGLVFSPCLTFHILINPTTQAAFEQTSSHWNQLWISSITVVLEMGHLLVSPHCVF